jgi:UDP-N-acetylglucosamine--N-acetylmuramyl-(pentapeptide) pyrophosphoryl-undecaprenol N-acetylglucosamine transferase
MAEGKSAGDTLWVASAGGHLEQARMLSTRIGTGHGVWVTYDVPQAASLMKGEEVIYAHHPTTKNIGNALRNYRLARGIFRERPFSRVVSTGAAVAVPFMVRARQLGLPCHYIESATRVRAPSLSGRVLQAVPGIRLYRQMGTWGGDRWRPGPCVFDGFQASAVGAGADSGAVRRVVVSLGTHEFPFPALVERLREEVPPGLEDLVWQLGSTANPGDLPGAVIKQLPPQGLKEAIRAADVLVGHCGVGLALTALSAGKVPVMVPRRRRRREHTDDHQVELACELDRRGLAVVAEAGELRREHLERAAGLVASWHKPPSFELVD